MSEEKRLVSRSQMSAQERKTRSRLAQIISAHGLMRGSLLVRRRKCGRPTCHCAQGEGHESLYLVISEKGRTRQLFVPKEWESRVRQWVEDHRQARQLMEEVSRIYWDKLRKRQG